MADDALSTINWRLFVYERTGEPLPRRGDPPLLMAHSYGEHVGAWRAQNHFDKWGDNPYRKAWRQFVEQFPDVDRGMLNEWYVHGLYSAFEVHRVR